MTDTNVAQREAYTATGERWQTGPGRIYDRMAEVLVAHVPRPLDGAVVVDVGAGTGAASRAATAAGAAVVIAVDAAYGMLAAGSRRRPPAVVGDATHLPVRTASADVVLAAFSFNHLADPAAGFAEAARVARPGGAIAVSTYAADDDHPVEGDRRRGTAARSAGRPRPGTSTRGPGPMRSPRRPRAGGRRPRPGSTPPSIGWRCRFPSSVRATWWRGASGWRTTPRSCAASPPPPGAGCSTGRPNACGPSRRCGASILVITVSRVTPALAMTWPRQSAARRTQSDTP